MAADAGGKWWYSEGRSSSQSQTNEMPMRVSSGFLVQMREGSGRANGLSGWRQVCPGWATTLSTAHASHELPPSAP